MYDGADTALAYAVTNDLDEGLVDWKTVSTRHDGDDRHFSPAACHPENPAGEPCDDGIRGSSFVREAGVLHVFYSTWGKYRTNQTYVLYRRCEETLL